MQKRGILIAHWNGRFGNRMHQYAYAAQYAEKFRIPCILPSEWEGSRLFARPKHQIVEDDQLRLLLNQSQPVLDNFAARSRAIDDYNARSGAAFECLNPDNPYENWAGKPAVFIDSLCAYQPSIFNGISAKYLREELFVFSREVQNTAFFREYCARQGTYDVAHLRRDDIADPSFNRMNVQGYSVLSKESYFKAFRKFGFDAEKIEWVSDDYLGKWHPERAAASRGGWSYPVGSEYMGADTVFDWLPDFIKLYFARTIFRANSSFSWWAAFLSPAAKVYSPVIHKQEIYGRDSYEEMDYEFVEGNHPHWMFGCADIRFQEESAALAAAPRRGLRGLFGRARAAAAQSAPRLGGCPCTQARE